MKRTVISVAALGVLFLLTQCSSSKKLAAVPGEAELALAQKRWPEATLADLEAGRSVYSGPCTNCHGMKTISGRSEESWIDSIERMAPKAKITDEQKRHLTVYVLTMLEASAAK